MAWRVRDFGDGWILCHTEAEARKSPRPMPGQTAQVMAKREGTTVYPRLSLAPGQRFASKGAFIVHFAADGKAVVPESEWIVP